MQLSMEFDGHCCGLLSDANNPSLSDLQNIYEGQILSQSFQVGLKIKY